MMNWTKTPPKDLGFYWIRSLERIEHDRPDERMVMAIAERSRDETDAADGSQDDWIITGWDVPTSSETMVENDYEFWPVRIEPPGEGHEWASIPALEIHLREPLGSLGGRNRRPWKFEATVEAASRDEAIALLGKQFIAEGHAPSDPLPERLARCVGSMARAPTHEAEDWGHDDCTVCDEARRASDPALSMAHACACAVCSECSMGIPLGHPQGQYEYIHRSAPGAEPVRCKASAIHALLAGSGK